MCNQGGPAVLDRPRAFSFDGTTERVSRAKRKNPDTPVGISIDPDSKLALLRKLIQDSSSRHPTQTPIALAFSGTCARGMIMSMRPRHLLLLVDNPDLTREHRPPPASNLSEGLISNDITIPYVVSQPRWLTHPEEMPPPEPPPPWVERKLLFFAGHIPKLALSRMRFDLWRALRRSSHVSALSHSLWCTVGSYFEACGSPTVLQDHWKGFCRPFCNASCGASCRCIGSAKELVSACRHHPKPMAWERAHLRFDMQRMGNVRLKETKYLSQAMRHRFCLVAPGDSLATRKLPQTIAIAAAGGCLPFLVLPRVGALEVLPYSSRIDYCRISVIVFDDVTRGDTAARELVHKLLALPPARIAAMRRALRRESARFVFRNETSIEPQPSAAEHILREACATARQKMQPSTSTASSASIATRARVSYAAGPGLQQGTSLASLEKCALLKA